MDPANQEVVEIPVGTDRMQAHFIADECRAKGFTVELVVFDETRAEMGSAAAVENRILVRGEDRAAVLQIIQDLHPES